MVVVVVVDDLVDASDKLYLGLVCYYVPGFFRQHTLYDAGLTLLLVLSCTRAGKGKEGGASSYSVDRVEEYFVIFRRPHLLSRIIYLVVYEKSLLTYQTQETRCYRTHLVYHSF